METTVTKQIISSVPEVTTPEQLASVPEVIVTSEFSPSQLVPTPIVALPFTTTGPGEYVFTSNQVWNGIGPAIIIAPIAGSVPTGIIINFQGFVLALAGNAIGISASGISETDLASDITFSNVSIIGIPIIPTNTGITFTFCEQVKIVNSLFSDLAVGVTGTSSDKISVSKNKFSDNTNSVIMTSCTQLDFEENGTSFNSPLLGILPLAMEFINVVCLTIKNNHFLNTKVAILSGSTIRFNSNNLCINSLTPATTPAPISLLQLGDQVQTTGQSFVVTGVLVRLNIVDVVTSIPTLALVNLVSGIGVTIVSNDLTVSDQIVDNLAFAGILIGTQIPATSGVQNLSKAVSILKNSISGYANYGVITSYSSTDISIGTIVKYNSSIYPHIGFSSGTHSFQNLISDNDAVLADMSGFQTGFTDNPVEASIVLNNTTNGCTTGISLGNTNFIYAEGNVTTYGSIGISGTDTNILGKNNVSAFNGPPKSAGKVKK